MIARLLLTSSIVASLVAPLVGSQAHAESNVTKLVRTQMVRLGVGAGSSFCYADDGGPIQGYNIDKPVKIASVMKLLTTFWAIEKLGPDFRFTTRIYIQPSNKEMHIEGQRDPFFDRQRLGLLLADLNRMGFKNMNRVTADGNFRIDYDALNFMDNWRLSHSSAHAGISLADDGIKGKLDYGFNTAGWDRSDKLAYTREVRRYPGLKLPAGVVFKADAVDVVPGNPLAGKPGVRTLQIKSAPLKTYLREMNILSINGMADELFAALGGPSAFRAFMRTKFGAAFDFSQVYTGSGLPTGGVRRDTRATCRAVVSVIQKMDRDLEARHSDLNQVMMISGVDVPAGATLVDKSKTLMLKTGTVNGGRNIAGAEQAANDEIYFGIFMQGPKVNKYYSLKALEQFKMGIRAKRAVGAPLHFQPIDGGMRLSPYIALGRL